MEKPVQEQSLKCPRCDSSNTKFCYYNNYSLSQPRHFCKACKRYWTRGGTLRTVPIGGGCRKNKRVKRPAAASTTDAAAPPLLAPSSTPTSPFPHIDISMASNHISPLFYGLPNNPSDINFSFSRHHSRVSNVDTVPTSCTGYNIQPQLNPQGMGFCSSTKNSDDEHGDEYRAGFNPTAAQIQGVTSSSLLSNYSLFGCTDSRTTCPTTASLIASNLQLQKLIRGGFKETRPTNHFQSLLPLADLKMVGNHDPALVMAEIKMEEGNNLDRICNEEWSVPFQNQIEPIGSATNPSLYWNATSVGAWPDLTNFGSSVTSLI